MAEKAYLMTFKDQMAAQDVRKILFSLGASILDPCEVVRMDGLPLTHQESLIVAITVHDRDEDFAEGQHTRVCSSIAQATEDGFHVSNSFRNEVSLQLVPVLVVRLSSVGNEGLKEELISFHTSDITRESEPRAPVRKPHHQYMFP